jgi:hypothetical protein
MYAGLEFQTTVFAFKHAGVLGDVVFKKYRIINKGNKAVDSMFLGYWSDPDLGDGSDDFVGCDTILNLGYCYNGDNDDGGGSGSTYGNPPPAVGYKLVQGPIRPGSENDSAKYNGRWQFGFNNVNINSFIFLIRERIPPGDPQPIPPDSAKHWYYYIRGYYKGGIPFIDPTTSSPIKFILAGDPVSGTGWYEGPGWPGGPAPSDRRTIMGFGPVTFLPGDTQEVVIAIIMARGSDNIQSVAELKKKAATVQKFYDLYKPELVNTEYVLPKPDYYYLGQNYPNPFNPTTTIKYELPVRGLVTLKVYDILGNEIHTLVNTEQDAGEYEVKFNQEGLSSGIYFYHLTSREFNRTRKMLILK